MSGAIKSLFGGGGSASPPSYTGLQIQTAVNAVPVAIVWGEAKISTNVIWYNGFAAHASGGGGGGKGGIFNAGSAGSGQYTYTADVILALCEGPINGINAIWRDQSTYTLAQLDLTLFTGTSTQAVWSFLNSAYPSQALAYQSTAYCAGQNYNLSSAATLANHNFEVQGIFYGSGVNAIDADPALVIDDFLTNPQYGVGFPAASIDTTTLFGSGNDASLQTYCAGVGICMSPALTSQEAASSILDRWLKICNAAAVWSSGLLRFIPYGDTATTAGTVQTSTIEVDVPAAGTFLTAIPSIYVGPPASFVADRGVTYAVSGAALTYIGASASATAAALGKIGINTIATGTYGISPNGTYLFGAGDENAAVVISWQSTTAASFTPNVTPIYDLTADDYIDESNADPVTVQRSDPYKASNILRLESAVRANAYNLTPIEARDQSAVELYGPRLASTVTAHEVCDPNVAAISSQLMLQRSVYIRNTYKFRLDWVYCLLDPMDIVTITETLLGLNKTAIRITSIEEDENGYLSIDAEEFPNGVATASLYGTDYGRGTPTDRNVSAGDVNAAVIFEPSDELAARLVPGGGLMVAIALSNASPLCGGAQVWMSYSEGGPYTQIGTATMATTGVLTADLPTVTLSATTTTIDTTSTASVDLSRSIGSLAAGSHTDALGLNDAFYCGGEVLSYGSAVLTSTYNYNCTYLVRAAYGTESSVVDHPAGTSFTFIDDHIFTFPYDQNRIGATIYLKFPTFNVYSGGLQSLDQIGAYPFLLTGVALSSPLPNVTSLNVNYEAGFEKLYWDEIEDFRNGIMYEIRQGTGSWDSALFIRTQAHPPFIFQGNGTFQIKARCQPVAGLLVYSETATTITVSGNQLALNLLASWDEKATGWTGTFDNGIGVATGDLRLGGAGNVLTEANVLTNPDVLDYGGIITNTPCYYTIPTSHIINAGSVVQASINATTQIVGTPLSQNVLTDTDRLHNPDVLGSVSTQYVDGWIEINVSQDGVTYAGWQKFVPGVFQGMAFNFRLALESFDPNTIAFALAFNFSVQLPSRIDHYQNLSVSSGGLTITFARDSAPSTPAAFNGGPATNNLPYYSVSNPNPFWQVTGLSKSQLTITFYTDNSFSTPTSATGVNVDVEGY